MSEPRHSIGPYSVERELGRGGMGVVLLGRDERLGRRVALKSLPPASGDSQELLARFEREGRVLASLSHPNIASVFGIEDHGGVRYLVMEYVEGETLAGLLRRGVPPVDEALSIAAQIAAGVEAAHEAGIVHRDLKPGNVMVSPDGRVKVLDFGLAKGGDGGTSIDARRADPNSPTATIASRGLPQHSPVTMPGRIMGSAGYLSPEQARGKLLDRRTDIFSFGCVLFECLTGKMTFGGETLSDTIAATLEREPRWEALPANTPPRVRELLSRCLEKDASKRLRDIGDARLELERALAGREWTSSFIAAHSTVAMPAPRRGWGRAAAMLTAGVLIGGVAGVAGSWWSGGRAAPTPHEPRFYSIAMPEGMEVREGLVSPDGRTLAFIASRRVVPGRTPDPLEQGVLYLRPFASAEARRIPDSHFVSDVCFSPDSRWFAYRTRVGGTQPTFRVVRAPVDGSSPPVILASSERLEGLNSLVWLSGDVIVGAARAGELVVMSSRDGKESRRFKVTGAGDNSTQMMLADSGNPGFLLAHVRGYGPNGFEMNVSAIDLASGACRVLVENAGAPSWDGGHRLYFSRSDQLLSVEYDPGTVSLPAGGGEVRSVASGLRTQSPWEHAYASISADGTACYVPGGVTASRRRIMVGHADGTSEAWCADIRPFEVSLKGSPDGSKVLATIANPSGLFELWISEAPGNPFRKLAWRASEDLVGACFSPDSERVYFGGVGRLSSSSAHYSVPLNSRAEPTMLGAMRSLWIFAASIDSQAKSMYFSAPRDDQRIDLMRQTLTNTGGFEGEAEVLVRGDSLVFNSQPSPDGRLLAYTSQEQTIYRLQIARINEEGIQGTPALIATSESGLNAMGWAIVGAEKRLELFWESANSIEYQPIRAESGVPEGTRRSIAKPERVAAVAETSGFGDGRFLYVERGPDEEAPGVLTIVTGVALVGAPDSSARRD